MKRACMFLHMNQPGKLLQQTHVKYSTVTKQKLEGQTKVETAPF